MGAGLPKVGVVKNFFARFARARNHIFSPPPPTFNIFLRLWVWPRETRARWHTERQTSCVRMSTPLDCSVTVYDAEKDRSGEQRTCSRNGGERAIPGDWKKKKKNSTLRMHGLSPASQIHSECIVSMHHSLAPLRSTEAQSAPIQSRVSKVGYIGPAWADTDYFGVVLTW